MEKYFEKGKEVLKILINNGFESYFIGEAVLKKIISIDLDNDNLEIITNATPDVIRGVFHDAKTEEYDGGIKLYYSGYEFIINTFRALEKFKDNRRPNKIHYSKKLEDELACRPFTITAITMSIGEKISDAYNGFKDIKRRRIKTIGKATIRFKENPLRMLTALRLVSEYGFKLDQNTFNAMKKRNKLIASLTTLEMLSEMKRIIEAKYFRRALKYLINSKVYKRIPVLGKELLRLSNNYEELSLDEILILSFVKAGAVNEEWLKIANSSGSVIDTFNLAIKNPKANYPKHDLFSYGLDVSLRANKVNHLLRKARNKKRKIKKVYKDLVIHNKMDLAFSETDMIPLITISEADYVEEIMDDIARGVLSKELENDFDVIKTYAMLKLEKLTGRTPQIIRENIPSTEQKPILYTPVESREVTYEMVSHHPNHKDEGVEYAREPIIYPSVIEPVDKVKVLEDKVKALERQNLEIKLENDVNNIVGQNLEILKDMNYISGPEKIMVSRELKNIYRGLITEVDPKLRNLKETNRKEGNEENNENEN